VAIGAAQRAIARQQVVVAAQELRVSELQASHARETMEFLGNKFLNADMYDWMARVLSSVYAFFLQHATAAARLAEEQLSFERQAPETRIIRSDYWSGAGSGFPSSPSQAQGLTGSARLLEDITSLDEYAVSTNRRKLQLTKTFSLSRLDGLAFQSFRETGVMPFETALSVFDLDFPGHYLRLIRQVRTSVVALIPPVDGIHATLFNPGRSHVVIGSGSSFRTTTIIRETQSVALTSPRDASGVVELLPEDTGLLLPFEGLGVASSWIFTLPRASNLFDFNTIADVLVTIEYTALESSSLRARVVRALRNTVRLERAYSLRQDFADAWYDLHNPDQSATPMQVALDIAREDFPPNLDRLAIEQLIVHVGVDRGAPFDLPITLSFEPEGSTARFLGTATAVDGTVSTRRANGSSWTPMLGASPVGSFVLSLPDSPALRSRFTAEEIGDILFIVSFRGSTPSWPE
jgi:hypothetical protein